MRTYPTGHGYQVVEIMEGDHLVEIEKLPLPRAVKIDVEGYEYAVIRGLSQTLVQPDCELVCCEIHPSLLPAEVKPQDVLDLLKSLGFTHIDLYPLLNTYHTVCYKRPQRDRKR
jgi:hypothetical protein